jgi:hypothetical protein
MKEIVATLTDTQKETIRQRAAEDKVRVSSLDDETKNAIVKMYIDGKTPSEIVKSLGKEYRPVYNVIANLKKSVKK